MTSPTGPLSSVRSRVPRLDRSEQSPSPSSPELCSSGSSSSMATCLRLALRVETASSWQAWGWPARGEW